MTHLTNGCYRLHPVEWAIGEAAGTLAAASAAAKCNPVEIHESAKRRADYFNQLETRGVRRFWAETKAL